MEETFEARCRFQGREVRRCRRCSAGLFVGGFGARLIPEDLWAEMNAEWDRTFGVFVTKHGQLSRARSRPAPDPTPIFDSGSNELTLEYQLENYKVLNIHGLRVLLDRLHASGDESAIPRIEEELERRCSSGSTTERTAEWDVEHIREADLSQMPTDSLEVFAWRARATSHPTGQAANEIYCAELRRRGLET